MSLRVWHHVVGPRSGAIDSALDALGRKNVRVTPLDTNGGGASHDTADTAGLLFYAGATEATCDLLRVLSVSGRRRVLAVATTAARGVPAWQLLRAGASDVLQLESAEALARDALAHLERWAEVDRLIASPLVEDNLVGTSPAWVSMLRQLVEAARFAESPILLQGETGTGKELAARLVHSLARRAAAERVGGRASGVRASGGRDIVVVDCGTLRPELSGSELFGHERGAFTGAVTPRDGAFALADGGTLFLDEIGELPLLLQPELLRAVQERTFKRLGSNAWQTASFRLVSATNRDLHASVERGEFRADLYYRIASVTVQLPPLAERPDDVLALTAHFIAQHYLARHEPTHEAPLDDAVRDYLVRRAYPGNTRELKQLVARMMQRHVGNGPITVGDLPPAEWPEDDAPGAWLDAVFDVAVRRAVLQGIALREIGQAATDAAIRVAVEADGTVSGAARRLGVTERALQKRRAAWRQHEKDTLAAAHVPNDTPAAAPPVVPASVAVLPPPPKRRPRRAERAAAPPRDEPAP